LRVPLFRLYTYGYQGGSPQDLQHYAAAGALILDTRLAPTSPNPLWRRASLKRLLGDRYRWCKALGNVNFRSGGPVQLHNPEAGMDLLDRWIGQSPVVLLCACRDWRTCHRRVAAELAQEQFSGLRVVHLSPGDPLADLEAGG
jgi:uncharacterized protein (DUF488 family)